LPLIAAMAERFARARNLRSIEWLVRATACARPNPRLRPLLERIGFTVTTIPGRGECYYRRVDVTEGSTA
jgi:hypothetical protein